MKRTLRVIMVGFVGMLLAVGCGPSKENVQATVKQRLQQELDTNKDFSPYKMSVKSIELVAESSKRFKGFAVVGCRTDEHKVGITVTTDGDSLMYQTDPFTFLAQYAVQDATRGLPISKADLAKYRECEVAYMSNVGATAAGISFGKFVEALDTNKKDWIAGSSADGQRTIITIRSGGKEVNLHFTCNAAQHVCVIAGGIVDGQEFDSMTALSTIIALVGQ